MHRQAGDPWRPWVWLLALVSLAAAPSLTKDDVLRMAEEGRSDQVILAEIQAAHVSFDLTADDIGALRKAGVGESVIDAMIESRPGLAPVESASRAEVPTNPIPPPQPVLSSMDTGQSAWSDPYSERYATSTAVSLPDDGYAPGPVPAAYPAYPLYYPVYYPAYFPVQHPFFPFFGGCFSFGFVHFSHVFSVFPFHHSVFVKHAFFVRPAPFHARGAFVTSRTRVISRGGPGAFAPRVNAMGGRATAWRGDWGSVRTVPPILSRPSPPFSTGPGGWSRGSMRPSMSRGSIPSRMPFSAPPRFASPGLGRARAFSSGSRPGMSGFGGGHGFSRAHGFGSAHGFGGGRAQAGRR